jgi:ribonuclease E
MSNTNNKMLIDATHPEETRVVVLKNGRVEEFDFESAARKLLRGNIYLAKVTRVEPSLQAAFVDYGGNRHGFLAFSEIHPDYYQIPMADRQALIEEEAAQEAAEEAEVDAHAERLARRRQREGGPAAGERGRDRDGGAQFASDGDDAPVPEVIEEGSAHEHHIENEITDGVHDHIEGHHHHTMAAAIEGVEQITAEVPPPVVVGGFDPTPPDDTAPAEEDVHAAHDDHSSHAAHDEHGSHDGHHDDGHHDDHGAHEHGMHEHDVHEHGHVELLTPAALEALEPVGAEDTVEEMPQRPRRRPRSYKIQEVIKRRQVILVQVVKEERGNKGAALTTYLSLAGRYTVLMPNTARGGGISRKITQPQDRKRLKAIANELEVPEGMGLIIRTAGASRTSQEIKRDFEYLLRLWESVRELTLASTAPSLVYEEGNLIKRSIRDLYTKDVEEVVVAGDVAHKEARDFMRMLMPSHAQNVIEYKGAEPLFTRYRMEQQLAAMFSPQVTLKSGGYLVINQTEALVAIDVNSGKSTREYSIEETAHSTNLEAADEIARQLKLRDLAGLVVIDFIDMEDKRNIRSVERRLKDALRFDRARIQLGRISHFGLMEMSRQRLRTGVLEGSTSQCPHCQGTGIIRSIESIALAVIRGLEDALMSGTRMALVATTTSQVALYILNAKRAYVTDMEARHGLSVTIQGSDKLQGANFTIDKVAAITAEPALRRRSPSAVNMEWGFDGENDEPRIADVVAYDEPEDEDGSERDGEREARPDSANSEEGRKRRRRRGRRGRRDERPGEDAAMAGAREGRAPGDEDYAADSHIVDVGSEDLGPEEFGGEDADAGEPGVSQGRPSGEGETEGEGRSRRGRRRGRRGGRRGGQGREGRDGGALPPLAANDEDGVERDRASSDEPHLATDASGEPDRGHRDHRRHHMHEDVLGHGGQAHAEHGHVETHAEVAEPAHATPASATEAKPHRAEPARSAPVAAVSETKPAAVAAAEPVSSPVAAVPAPEPVKPRRSSTVSSEPVLERVVVTPHAGAETAKAAEADAAKPTRKGWWQKKLGLE